MTVFNIDINSADDLLKHINILKGHFGLVKNSSQTLEAIDYSDLKSLQNMRGKISIAIDKLKSNLPQKSTWDIQKEKLDLIVKVWQTDLSMLFNTLNLDISNKYYVYAHTVSRNLKVNKKAEDAFAQIYLNLKEKPFYIGKGTGNRFAHKERNEYYNKYRTQLLSEGLTINHTIIKDNLSEYEALELESKIIDIFGIKAEKGQLLNLDSCYKPLLRRKMYPLECRVLFPTYIQEQLIAVDQE